MSRRNVLLISAAGCLLAVGIAVALSRSPEAGNTGVNTEMLHSKAKESTHAALPPVGAPLAQTLPMLTQAAKAGDSAARVRLFTDVATCLGRNTRENNLAALSRNKDWIVNNPELFKKNGVVDEQMKNHALDVVEDSIRRVEASTEMCANAPVINDGRIYQFALVAAQAGDTTAASCLMSPVFDKPTLSREEGEAFGEQARAAAEAAVTGGDWRLVDALKSAYSDLAPIGMNVYTSKNDPSRAYRYGRLMRHGYSDGSPEASQLDAELSAMSEAISPAQRADDDKWAMDMYRDHFFTAGPAIPDTPSCPF